MTSASEPESDAEVEPQPQPPLTRIFAMARSGLRRDVMALVEALDDVEAELLVPLAREIPGTALGERQELDGELTLAPHLLPDAEGQLFAALFTYPDPLEPIVSGLDWTTDGEPLKLCSLPPRLALEMARDLIDEKNVFGVVIDPGSESELCLTRAEVASMLAGKAIPLLAYVAQIPAEERDRTLVADGAEPPSSALVSALDAFRSAHPDVRSYKLNQTFNADRDLEPHLTLVLDVDASADRSKLFERVTKAVEGLLPPPGYVDVLFEGS